MIDSVLMKVSACGARVNESSVACLLCHCAGVSQRHVESKVLHAKHAHLCKALSTSEIVDELYSGDVITSYEMGQLANATDTERDKNRRLLKFLERRHYPIKDLCRVLDKFEPFKYLANDLRAGQL